MKFSVYVIILGACRVIFEWKEVSFRVRALFDFGYIYMYFDDFLMNFRCFSGMNLIYSVHSTLTILLRKPKKGNLRLWNSQVLWIFRIFIWYTEKLAKVCPTWYLCDRNGVHAINMRYVQDTDYWSYIYCFVAAAVFEKRIVELGLLIF